MESKQTGAATPNPVYCDVQNCTYHDGNGFCTASKLHVGPAHAISSNDTLCVTFKPQSK